MSCEKYNHMLSAYADGELGKREGRAVQAHVRQCARCRQDLIEIQHLKGLMRAAPTPSPRAAFWSDSFRLVRSLPSPQPRSWGRPTFVATVALGAFVVFLLAPHRPDPEPARMESAYSSIHPYALVSLHAGGQSGVPLADTGSLRLALTEAVSADLSDGKLDVE